MQFNQQQKSRREETRSTNKAGGESFDPASPELALTKVVITNLLEDTYYQSDEEQFAAVEEQFERCAEANPEFVLKLAAYARQEENLRQIPQALLVLAVENEETHPFVEKYATAIMSRADEPLDVVALWVARNSTSIPGVLKRSIEDALHQYNEWQYAKWDQPNKEWQYRDLLNVVHPNPQDEEHERIFEQIAHGELSDYEDVDSLTQEDTWESALSDDDDERSKESKYREQLAEGNMGLFPRIRQARDMLDAGVTADEIFGEVTDEWIRNSRLYPFRFYQAYKAIDEVISESALTTYGSQSSETEIPSSEARAAKHFLQRAITTSAENLPDVLDDTFVAVDTSGSMRSPVSGDSDLECAEIAALFGALVYRNGADLAAFASSVQQFDGDRLNTVTSLAQAIQEMPVGGGTHGYLVPKLLRENDLGSYNQVVVFTDMQLYGGSFDTEWRKYTNQYPDTSLYLVDLNSYGDLAVPEGAENVYQISGWSENVIDFIDKMENVDGMIREIESYEP